MNTSSKRPNASIVVDLNVPEGTATCIGCHHLQSRPSGFFCRANRDEHGYPREIAKLGTQPPRLPECIAGEREKVPNFERWEVGFERFGKVMTSISPFRDLATARDYAKLSRKYWPKGTKIRIIHVTRYRRAGK